MKDFKQIIKSNRQERYSYIFSVNQVCVYTCGKTTYLIALMARRYPGGSNLLW